MITLPDIPSDGLTTEELERAIYAVARYEVQLWMESLGWQAVEVDGKVTGYRYGERTLIKPDVAANWYAIRETRPEGPPRF